MMNYMRMNLEKIYRENCPINFKDYSTLKKQIKELTKTKNQQIL